MFNEKDYSLNSGERQVGKSIHEIRRDHTLRYDLAKECLLKKGLLSGLTCIDVFCGNGYGTFMLSEAFPEILVIGVDGSKDAIDMANEYYTRPNNMFSWKLFPFSVAEKCYDLVACFESLEHVENDQLMLDRLLRSLKRNGIALVSVPNQDKHPLEKNSHPFHFRHYRHAEFMKLIPSSCNVETWYGQNVYEFTPEGVNTYRILSEDDMCLKEQTPGQINIYVIRSQV